MLPLPRLRARVPRSTRLGLACAAWAAIGAGAAFTDTPDARAAASAEGPAPAITLSVVGTSDLHGRVFTTRGRGGLALLGGYLRNLREARRADGGAVLLLDAGDTFQGGIESNLSEGAIVVDAYNALGYTAAAIGNHEFDFGPADVADFGTGTAPDPRGALKAAAARATYPFLAANLFEDGSSARVDWPNVHPSTLVEAAGVKVGIVGVMTIEALRATLSVNVRGLRVAPLAEAIAAEASTLRRRGATVVLVAAHAGGRCTRFDAPTDLSSCDEGSEIFELARRLPPGLVDAIVAGHTHAGVAHQVAGIAIVEGLSLGLAFSRVDLTVDRRTGRVTGARPFPPQDVCALQAVDTGACAEADDQARVALAVYEQRAVVPDDAVRRAMEPALGRVRARQAVPLDVELGTPIGREGDLESPLGNLFAQAMAEATGADVAINNNKIGGLRADLDAGPLTFGRLYNVFPFDDRLLRLSVTGAQLRAIFAADVRRARRGSLGVSGISVRASCSPEGLHIALTRPSGASVTDEERLTLATTDLLARGPLFASLADEDRLTVPDSAPMAREVVAGWLTARGGRLSAGEFLDPARPRWDPFDARVSRCEATSTR